MLAIRPNKNLSFSIAFAAVIALTACQTTQKPVSGYSKMGSVLPAAEILNANLQDAGAIFIAVNGNDTFPHKLWLNETPLIHQEYGVVFLPVLPGKYDFRYNSNGSIRSMSVPVAAGKTSFVLGPYAFAFGAYSLASELEFKESWWAENPVKRIFPDRPIYEYLPADKKAVVDSCLARRTPDDCTRALDEVPNPILSASGILDRIEAASNRTPPVTVSVQQNPVPVPQPAPEPRIASLPPEIERDRLMVQIADLFKANNAANSLPLFDRLNALPVPIDPVSDYYWAQALFASGDKAGASVKLTRFLQKIDANSPFYAPALRLMTKIEG